MVREVSKGSYIIVGYVKLQFSAKTGTATTVDDKDKVREQFGRLRIT